jgi:hypothetical protein
LSLRLQPKTATLKRGRRAKRAEAGWRDRRGGEGRREEKSTPYPRGGIEEVEAADPEEEDDKDEDLAVLQQHVDFFNREVAPVLKCPTVKKLTRSRARNLRRRLEEHPDLWKEILAEAPQLAQKFNTQAYSTVDPIIDKIAAASVAVPTVAHLAVARPLLERGIGVLIEKPLAPDSKTARELLETARRHNTLLQVGHTERFNPVVRAMHAMKVWPRFIETHRISPFTFRSADIGVVMDMMIHDIDIVLSLVRAKAIRVEAVGVSVLGAYEDIANAWVTFEGGCVANLTASRLALKTER